MLQITCKKYLIQYQYSPVLISFSFCLQESTYFAATCQFFTQSISSTSVLMLYCHCMVFPSLVCNQLTFHYPLRGSVIISLCPAHCSHWIFADCTISRLQQRCLSSLLYHIRQQSFTHTGSYIALISSVQTQLTFFRSFRKGSPCFIPKCCNWVHQGFTCYSGVSLNQ